MIAPLTQTSGAMEDRLEGTLIVKPFGTLSQVITTMVTSDPCPSVQWSFHGRNHQLNITNGSTGFMLNDPCVNETNPYYFTLTIGNLTADTSGQYSAVFTILNQAVILPRLFVTVPGESATGGGPYNFTL